MKHFAEHAVSIKTDQTLSTKIECSDGNGIPALFPIKVDIPQNQHDSDRGSDSGVEDVNPIKFCLVTLEENCRSDDSNKKFACCYCHKRFSWSTDLKRHILTHTGK